MHLTIVPAQQTMQRRDKHCDDRKEQPAAHGIHNCEFTQHVYAWPSDAEDVKAEASCESLHGHEPKRRGVFFKLRGHKLRGEKSSDFSHEFFSLQQMLIFCSNALGLSPAFAGFLGPLYKGRARRIGRAYVATLTNATAEAVTSTNKAT